jgi:heme exporter protein C
MICAVYGIVAFVDVPLVYLSTKLMKDIHPTSISLEPTMQLTLLVWFVAVAFLTGGLMVSEYQNARAARRLLEEPLPEPAGEPA